MRFVRTINEIRDNMSKLDEYISSSNTKEREFSKERIKQGLCYVADNSSGIWRFYPSRFVGYANNSMKDHINNDAKNGTETNPIISKLLSCDPIINDSMEEEFRNYCDFLEIVPKNNHRKYWVLNDLDANNEHKIRQEYDKHLNLLDDYIKNEYPSNKKDAENADLFLSKFKEKYPRDKINIIPMDKFIFAPKGFGYEKSFCRQLMYSPLASMGDNRPSIFGIYLKGGVEIKLSKTFDYFGTGYENALDEIENQIVDLLNAADNYDYEKIDRCKLNSAFKNILLSVYHPDKFLPAPTHTALDAYCEALGLVFPSEKTMAYRNHSLVEWKKTVSECKAWDNFILMRFCDWLWRSGKRIDGKSLTENRLHKRVNEISDELNDLDLKGETRDAVVKVRVNQSEFRDRLLGRYNHCCLCGVSNSSLLIASHIKPWSVSEADEKLDVDNGLLLCPNHDQLFDQGFISFNDNGNILISPLLEPNDKIFLNVNESMKIDLTNRNIKYMNYHRDNIFRK